MQGYAGRGRRLVCAGGATLMRRHRGELPVRQQHSTCTVSFNFKSCLQVLLRWHLQFYGQWDWGNCITVFDAVSYCCRSLKQSTGCQKIENTICWTHQATNKKGALTWKNLHHFPPPLPFLSCHAKSRGSTLAKVNWAQCTHLKFVDPLHHRILPHTIEVSLLTLSRLQMYTVLSRACLSSILNTWGKTPTIRRDPESKCKWHLEFSKQVKRAHQSTLLNEQETSLSNPTRTRDPEDHRPVPWTLWPGG